MTATIAERVREALAQFENQDIRFLWPQDVEDFFSYLSTRGLAIVDTGVAHPKRQAAKSRAKLRRSYHIWKRAGRVKPAPILA